MKSDNLLKRFEEIHDFIYANDGLSPQQTLEEFIKILFIKVYDEGAKSRKFSISTREWQDLSSRGEHSVFISRQLSLFEETKSIYSDVFESDDRIRLSPLALGFTVNKLQSISLSDSQQDAKGLAFQKFLSHHEKKGNGQFFTPPPVIDFCVKIINPEPSETVIDPSCGSGGFLMAALNHVASSGKLDKGEYISTRLFGIDINRSIRRIAKLKLILEASVPNNILCANSLDDLDTLKLGLGADAGFDIVLANPPFGAKISNPATLSGYDLGYKWTIHDGAYYKTQRHHANQSAEVLFLERCVSLLRPGGRMAIVLPNGNFENPSLDYVRHYIRLVCHILAIIKLPQETFVPYGTGVKTSLLFVQKRDRNPPPNEGLVFFGEIKKLGYQGNKNGSPIYLRDSFGRTVTGKDGKPVLDEDFSAVVSRWQSFIASPTAKLPQGTFSIPESDLNGRLDFDFYSPENRKLLQELEGARYARLGDICDIVKTKSPKLRDAEMTAEYVELSDVNAHTFEIIASSAYQICDLPSRATYELATGDIITAVAGNSVGTLKHATALVTRDHHGAICTNGFRILRNPTVDPYYLLFFMRSENFLRQMYMYRTGAAIPNVSDSDLSNILVSLPPDDLQAEIGKKVQRAFKLRSEARSIFEQLVESNAGCVQ